MAGRQVAELFAGVGGFRLGLERAGWEVVWSNQWEPSTRIQHASDCYVSHFGPQGHECDDVAGLMDKAEAGEFEIPDVDLVCGGFPCQDYSVAKTLNQATGLAGKRGVLWWEIVRFLKLKRPRYLLLENVDRLLKSPASQRGRDFAVMLACLNDLGYLVEWRVINAADYGFPQKRRRVFVVGHRVRTSAIPGFDADRWIFAEGVLARSLSVVDRSSQELAAVHGFAIDGELDELSATFGRGLTATPFENGGVAANRKVWTTRTVPRFRGKQRTLAGVLQPPEEVDARFYISKDQLSQWKYLKGAKRAVRRAANGHEYTYQEGAIPFPDPIDGPSRTILTGEGGRTPTRSKHIVKVGRRYRRLTPIELERLNGFPDDWTNTGMPDGRRAFMMGNALVVGLVQRIGKALQERLS